MYSVSAVQPGVDCHCPGGSKTLKRRQRTVGSAEIDAILGSYIKQTAEYHDDTERVFLVRDSLRYIEPTQLGVQKPQQA